MQSSPWFEEKARQVDEPSMLSFGVRITTRHAKARELVQLIEFTEEAARMNLNVLVEEAFYDSNSCTCTFKLRPGVDQYSEQAQAIKLAALKTISQFEWFGHIEHGRQHPDEEEPF